MSRIKKLRNLATKEEVMLRMILGPKTLERYSDEWEGLPRQDIATQKIDPNGGGKSVLYRFDNGYGVGVTQLPFTEGASEGLLTAEIIRFDNDMPTMPDNLPFFPKCRDVGKAAEISELIREVKGFPPYQAAGFRPISATEAGQLFG